MTQYWTIALLTSLTLAAGGAAAQDRAVLGADRAQASSTDPSRIQPIGAQAERSTMQLRTERPVSNDDAGYRPLPGGSMPGKLGNYRPRRTGGQDQRVESDAREMVADEGPGIIEMAGDLRERDDEAGRPSSRINSERISFDSLRKKTSVARKPANRAATTMLIAPTQRPEPADDE
jgi:hypothetical protein